MQFLTASILLLAMFVIAFIYPPALVCLSMLAAPTDAPMVSVFFTEISRIPAIVVYALTFLAACLVFWRIRSAALTNPIYKRKMIVATVAFGISIWIGLSVFATTGSVSAGISQSLSSGIYGLIFALVYHRNPVATILILIPVIIHLILGIAVTIYPNSPLSILRPLPAGLLDETYGISDDGVIRENGLFTNSVPFAFYAAIALLAGVFMVAYSQKLSVKIIGLATGIIGIWTSYMTIQRAIWIGIIIALFVMIKPLCQKWIGKLVYAAYFIALICICYLLYTYNDNAALANLRDFFLSTTQDEYRTAAAINSFDALCRMPLFGVGGDVQQLLHETGGMPHQSPYSVAVLYGIPAGIGVLFLTWICFPLKSLKKQTSQNIAELTHSEICLAKAVAWVVIAMALSNNMSAGMLGWICLGYGCLPWIYETKP